MLEYLKFIGGWVFFMALIAGITLLVPKIAKAIEKKFKQIKENRTQKFGIANLSDEAILPEGMLEKSKETDTAEAPMSADENKEL